LDRAAPTDLAFVGAPKYLPLAAATQAGVLLVPPALADAVGHVPARVVVADPQAALLALLPLLYVPPPRVVGVHPSAVIGDGAVVPSDAAIGPYAVIGHGARLGARATIHAHAIVGPGVTLGDDCEIGPHAVLHPGSLLGHRVRVRTGAAIGNEGFKFVWQDGAHRKLPHVGRCVLEDDVEVGANCCIDRGTVADTVIGAGTKLDNLVHVAHNVRVGRACLLIAQVGIAGSVQIGDGVILAGQVGVADNVTIGAGAKVAAQSGVVGDVPAGETWTGFPARPHRDQMRAYAALHKLAALLKPLERLVAGERRSGDA
ncbi:MAG: UDP-3-O-(3-hydroxymyristoyl)glucosamine N-acyltransferase, partial [Gemmatimonadaceae bacterium]|nr:UDP-3-O-(3-hydroxymyristoyl)glucosamine N-acyltransferase [Gemmatimonadaceae bacterium]